MTTSEAIAASALKRSSSKIIDQVQHGEVTFIIRDGAVQRFETKQSVMVDKGK